MEDEPINQNYLIGCDTIEHSPSLLWSRFDSQQTYLQLQAFQSVGLSLIAWNPWLWMCWQPQIWNWCLQVTANSSPEVATYA